MAIGPLHVEWLSSLASRGVIPAGARVLELGPQDVQVTPAVLRAVAARHVSDGHAVVDRVFSGDLHEITQSAFYSIFGCGPYVSTDLHDKRAFLCHDLNKPLATIGHYGLIANFGTTEHVFNIGQTFASIHRALAPGGIQLHAVPVFAFIEHGYYNVHPCAYIDAARANAYDLVDLHYVDDVVTRGLAYDGSFDFDALPLKADEPDIAVKAALRFVNNMLAAPLTPSGVFDLLFVAMRKTDASPDEFVWPVQGVWNA